MNDAILTTLKSREELKKVATLVEGTLRGNAKEAEALQLCFKSQSCAGGVRRRRKRKRGDVEMMDGAASSGGGVALTSNVESAELSGASAQ
eukprot:CAMPEP_0185736006 /NCGR_PEP_ID=MMETSP1171-20130828/26666_1 /TAXON_ID=374046 /ORGANISM="Helicotheca tamensis, Strain CCMP826" /LENGTH=90 /DNA_ID=CAMNT_0028406485 /DNA_START=420 /DNA_END=695 /DNA_ORIENTATION=+